MNLGPHIAFIAAAYAIAALVVLALVVWIAVDYRIQKHRLTDFEARGVTRRSKKPVKRKS